MNERIKKLAEQTGWRYDNGEWQFADDSDIEKFAELIVRECEKVISDGRYSALACEGNSHRVSYNNGRYGASLDIKKHFGVEE